MTTVVTVFSVAIKAKPEAVFNYVSNLTRHPEWSGAHLQIDPVKPGPVAVGSEYHSHGNLPTQKDRPNELRVTVYQPPTRFVFIAKDPDFGDVSHDFTFKAQDGGTLMERTVTIDMSPFIAIAFKGLISPLVGRPQMNKAFEKLKAKMEQSAA